MNSSGTVLDGGVASDVLIVREGDREVVIKQALPKLKVAADWRADPGRSSVEVEALRVAADLLGPGVVPQVLWVDPENHRFAMERIDPQLRNWRTSLVAGLVERETAARAGELLARLHTRSAQTPALAGRFSDRRFFEQLRIQPFFLRTAEHNPAIRDHIEAIVERLRAPGTALVHGDYSPKNLLASGARVVILDWEVSHWGDPRFDCAFCLSHLLLGGWRRNTSTEHFRQAALTFADTYLQHGPISPDDPHLLPLTGALVLARLDGDSPVDYLQDLDLSQVRHAAARMLETPENPRAVIGQVLK